MMRREAWRRGSLTAHSFHSLFLLFLLLLSSSPTVSFLNGETIQYLIPDILLLRASMRLHARPTHPLEIGWPGVRVYPLVGTLFPAFQPGTDYLPCINYKESEKGDGECV